MRFLVTVLLLCVLGHTLGLAAFAPEVGCADACPLERSAAGCPPMCWLCAPVAHAVPEMSPCLVAAPSEVQCLHHRATDEPSLSAFCRDISHVPKG